MTQAPATRQARVMVGTGGAQLDVRLAGASLRRRFCANRLDHMTGAVQMVGWGRWWDGGGGGGRAAPLASSPVVVVGVGHLGNGDSRGKVRGRTKEKQSDEADVHQTSHTLCRNSQQRTACKQERMGEWMLDTCLGPNAEDCRDSLADLSQRWDSPIHACSTESASKIHLE